jgi:uncharacterized protein YjbI with pentapeptide repeats
VKLSDVFEAVRQGQDLSGADMSDLSVRLVDLSGARLVGAVLRGKHRPSVVAGSQSVWYSIVDETERPLFGQFRASGADLRQADLTWAMLRKGHFRAADLREATIVEADLRDADLREADLRGADLTGSVLEGADLAGAVWDENTRWPDGFAP